MCDSGGASGMPSEAAQRTHRLPGMRAARRHGARTDVPLCPVADGALTDTTVALGARQGGHRGHPPTEEGAGDGRRE